MLYAAASLDLRLGSAPLVSITKTAAIGMTESEANHLISYVAGLRQYPRQHAAIAILTLVAILDAGHAHELLKLLRRALRKCPFLSASSAIASFRRVVTDDPVFDAFTPERVTIDDASYPLAIGADGPLILRCCRGR